MRIGMSIASPAASANSNYRYQPEHDHQDDDQDEEAAAPPPRIRGSLIPGTAPLVVTILLLLATVFTDPALAQSRNSSSPGRPRNRTGSTIDFSSNKVEHDDDDDDEYYLGHSGYLRSATSMIAAPSRLKNVTDYALYKISNSTHVSSKPSDGNRRVKRGVTHLYNMIVCATGCNPLAYKGYGCYCGFLGSGYPMDGIDRCCKMHDWCYDATDCPMFVEYFVPYYWKCYHGYKPICAIEHGEWGKSGSCAQRLCECDRAFAECLRRYPCPRHKAVCTSSPWRLIQNIFMTI